MKRALLTAASMVALCAACASSVPNDVPNATLAINMNVKIAPEVRASVEKDLEQLFSDEKAIF